ncbi:ABC transporter permease [Paradesulfitobacterium aromaticivorans]
MSANWWIDFILAMIREATPLIFGALAVLLAERAGVMFIGVEGAMLTGAITGFLGVVFSGSILVGILLSLVAGLLTGFIQVLTTVFLPTDQVVTGIAFNLTALGLTSFIYRIAGAQAQHIIPTVGPIIWRFTFFEVFGLVLTVAMWWFLFRTGTGLKLRSMGENAHAANAAGMNVPVVRSIVLLVSGIIASLGGAALTLGWVGGFTENITLGRGFIALAAVYFGRWNPLFATAAALVFGGGEALAFRAQATGAGLNTFYFMMIPYVLTLLVIGITGQSRGPGDVGKPYIRG